MYLSILIILANSAFIMDVSTAESTFPPTSIVNEVSTTTMTPLDTDTSSVSMTTITVTSTTDTTVTPTIVPRTTESPLTTTTEVIETSTMLTTEEPEVANAESATILSSSPDSSDLWKVIVIGGGMSILVVVVIICFILLRIKENRKDKSVKDRQNKRVEALRAEHERAEEQKCAKLRKKKSHGKLAKIVQPGINGSTPKRLPTFEDTPEILPDDHFVSKGPLVVTPNCEGPFEHAQDDVKSKEIEGPVTYDQTLNQKNDIGSNIEILKKSTENVQKGKGAKKDEDGLQPYQRNDGTEKRDAAEYKKQTINKLLLTV